MLFSQSYPLFCDQYLGLAPLKTEAETKMNFFSGSGIQVEGTGGSEWSGKSGQMIPGQGTEESEPCGYWGKGVPGTMEVLRSVSHY